MSGISSLGIGSGLELGSLVDNLVSLERNAAARPLLKRQARAEVRLSSLGIVKSAVSGLADALSGLNALEIGRSVTSSDAMIVTATATADADAATYSVEVQQLAAAQSLATDALNPFTDPDAELGEGTLTITVNGNSVDIDLVAGSNSLRNVRDAINASGADVRAAVVQQGSEYRLLLASAVTGTAGEIDVTVNGTIDSRLASVSMDETVASADAQFRVNGLDLSASSNTIEDVLPGLTLELEGVSSPGVTTTLSVAANVGDVQQRLMAFATAYNALVEGIGKVGTARPEMNSSGPLVGDPTVRSLQTRIGTTFATSMATGLPDNPFSTLVDIGVHSDENGRAVLDADTLTDALATNEAGVEALVTAFADVLGTKLDAFVGDEGILDFRTEQLGAELERISRQREALNRRLQQVELRLQKRFAALDSLVAQFQSTSSYLTQRLSSVGLQNGG